MQQFSNSATRQREPAGDSSPRPPAFLYLTSPFSEPCPAMRKTAALALVSQLISAMPAASSETANPPGNARHAIGKFAWSRSYTDEKVGRPFFKKLKNGDPRKTRTSGLRFRKPPLYPAELWGQRGTLARFYQAFPDRAPSFGGDRPVGRLWIAEPTKSPHPGTGTRPVSTRFLL
jgi:hypothetical protein